MKRSLFYLILAIFSLVSCQDAINTAEQEFKPSTLLKKYEYFKDLSAAIDAKRANISVYESQLSGIKNKESFQYQQSQTEMLGLVSMYNTLVSEYNSSMSKFNYAFCNKGTLPASNLEPLPREFKPYLTKINQ